MKDKENESPVPKYKRDLVQKMKILRQELQNLQPQGGHCRMEVSRDEIFEVRTMQKEIHLFSSPDPKGHVSYSHHLASVVRRKLFQKSSPLKVLDQWKPNLV